MRSHVLLELPVKRVPALWRAPARALALANAQAMRPADWVAAQQSFSDLARTSGIALVLGDADAEDLLALCDAVRDALAAAACREAHASAQPTLEDFRVFHVLLASACSRAPGPILASKVG
jgi:hypothetical protein